MWIRPRGDIRLESWHVRGHWGASDSGGGGGISRRELAAADRRDRARQAREDAELRAWRCRPLSSDRASRERRATVRASLDALAKGVPPIRESRRRG